MILVLTVCWRKKILRNSLTVVHKSNNAFVFIFPSAFNKYPLDHAGEVAFIIPIFDKENRGLSCVIGSGPHSYIMANLVFKHLFAQFQLGICKEL